MGRQKKNTPKKISHPDTQLRARIWADFLDLAYASNGTNSAFDRFLKYVDISSSTGYEPYFAEIVFSDLSEMAALHDLLRQQFNADKRDGVSQKKSNDRFKESLNAGLWDCGDIARRIIEGSDFIGPNAGDIKVERAETYFSNSLDMNIVEIVGSPASVFEFSLEPLSESFWQDEIEGPSVKISGLRNPYLRFQEFVYAFPLGRFPNVPQCPVCSRYFVAESRAAIYCSQACKQRKYNKKMRNVTE